MYKIILPIIGILLTFGDVYASSTKDGIDFFEKYQAYANNYDAKLLDMYSEDAKIIREVIKPTGETSRIEVPIKRYFKELKIGQKTAKLKRYKNKYKNIVASELPNGIKISAERQPSKETYWLKMYQVIEPTEDGFKIKEEMMQTKVQALLRYKK